MMVRDESVDGTTVPWRTLLAETALRLREADIEQASSDARWLVSEASGLEGAELIMGLGDSATVGGVRRLDAMVARRLAGEPVQYVLGHWSFRHLDLLVDRRVLIPRPETEVVVEHALAAIDDLTPRRPAGATVTVVDLGTGSGAIGLAIAFERSNVSVTLTDASREALAVARANLAGIGRPSTRVQLAAGSWFDALDPASRGRIDVLVSNPPYVAADEVLDASVAEWEPRAALVPGPAGTEDLEHLVHGALAWLAPDGVLVLEMAPWQTVAVADLARAVGFDPVHVHDDLTGQARIVVAARVELDAGSPAQVS